MQQGLTLLYSRTVVLPIRALSQTRLFDRQCRAPKIQHIFYRIVSLTQYVLVLVDNQPESALPPCGLSLSAIRLCSRAAIPARYFYTLLFRNSPMLYTINCPPPSSHWNRNYVPDNCKPDVYILIINLFAHSAYTSPFCFNTTAARIQDVFPQLRSRSSGALAMVHNGQRCGWKECQICSTYHGTRTEKATWP